MKVLLVTTSYPVSRADPSGIFVKRLAQALHRKKVSVSVLAPGNRGGRCRGQEEGVRVVRFSYAPRALMRLTEKEGGLPENLKRNPLLALLLPGFCLSLAIHALAMARSSDVIHANWLPTGLLCWPARVIGRRPLVVTLRGSDMRGALRRLLPLVVAAADRLTTVNRQWAEAVRRRFGTPALHTPNGVESAGRATDIRDRYGIGRPEVIALWVGALSRRKGADLLAEAARRLRHRSPSVRLLVIGPGNPREFGLCGLANVICPGSLPPAEVLAIYPACDLFLLPSRFEGRPNALLEAMSAGLPAVATPLPGVLEVVHPESALLVEVGDAAALAEAVGSLAGDPERRERMGRLAAARIRELGLDWDTAAERYLRIYARVSPCAA